MRIGFRRPGRALVIYLRRQWSVEIWLGRFGFYAGWQGLRATRTGTMRDEAYEQKGDNKKR
jgi:hypothetical protein